MYIYILHTQEENASEWDMYKNTHVHTFVFRLCSQRVFFKSNMVVCPYNNQVRTNRSKK